MEEKFNPEKASLKSPNVDCCTGGEAESPKDGVVWCPCLTGCLGADEYSDRIDVFKSGRLDFGAGLELTESGRGVACCAGPKKSSSPRRESPGFEDFGGAGSPLPATWLRSPPGWLMGLSDSGPSSNRLTSDFFGGAEAARGGGAEESCCLTACRCYPINNQAFQR